MKSVMSVLSSGHQNLCEKRDLVRRIPGWQAVLEVFPYRDTSGHKPEISKSFAVGQPTGTLVSFWVHFSIYHCKPCHDAVAGNNDLWFRLFFGCIVESGK